MQLELFADIVAQTPLWYANIENLARDTLVHEFQAGVMYSYKDLPRLVKQERVTVMDSLLFVNNACYVFDKAIADIGLVKQVLENKDVYTLNRINEIPSPKKCVEVIYDMNDVFEKKCYSTSKKFYQHVTRPLNLFKTKSFCIKEIISDKDIKEASLLHDKWVQYKLKNYNLYRHMFPEKRYIRCLQDSISNKWNNIHNVAVFDSNNIIRGFRCFYVIEDKCYDLAYITDREYEYSDFSELFEINTLFYIKNKYNVTTFNCGLSTGALKKFKQHLPNKEVVYWKYKKEKQKK